MGVRGLKYDPKIVSRLVTKVALLRGGAWIEMTHMTSRVSWLTVALLRGGAWIEIEGLASYATHDDRRTPSWGCVD